MFYLRLYLYYGILNSLILCFKHRNESFTKVIKMFLGNVILWSFSFFDEKCFLKEFYNYAVFEIPTKYHIRLKQLEEEEENK